MEGPFARGRENPQHRQILLTHCSPPCLFYPSPQGLPNPRQFFGRLKGLHVEGGTRNTFVPPAEIKIQHQDTIFAASDITFLSPLSLFDYFTLPLHLAVLFVAGLFCFVLFYLFI